MEREHAAAAAAYLAFNFASTVAVTFVNKVVFSRVAFGFPAALSNVHFVVTWAAVEVLRRCGWFEAMEPKPTWRDASFAALIFVVGVVTPLNNTSLKLNSIGVYQMFKLLVTPGIVLLEYALDGTRVSARRVALLTAVCACVLITTGTDSDFSPYGILCASVWVPLAVAYKVHWGRVKRQYECSTLQLMHAVFPYGMLVQVAVTPLVDPPGVLQFQWTPSAVAWLALSGIAAFFVNLSGFLVVGNISALAHVLLGQLKTAVIMVGAVFLFNAAYAPPQVLGAVGAIAAIIAYTQVTVGETAARAAAEAHVRV